METKIVEVVKNLEVNPQIMYIYGGFGVVLTEKISNYGSGKKTVYCGTIYQDTDDLESAEKQLAFLNWEITKIQKAVGCIINGSVKTMSDEEIAEAVDKKLKKAVDALMLLKTANFVAEAEETKIANNINKRKEELITEYKLKRDERKNSIEASELKKQLQQLAKEIAEATKKGDFAKVMELCQQQLAKQQEIAEAEA